jgi:hypothetical protein
MENAMTTTNEEKRDLGTGTGTSVILRVTLPPRRKLAPKENA